MKQGKSRSMSICLSDIKTMAADKIVKAKNGKLYINVSTWDKDEPDQFGNDFSVEVSPSKAETARRKEGEKVNRIFIGNGKIWESETQASPDEVEDLPF